jgi:hypothetical protein
MMATPLHLLADPGQSTAYIVEPVAGADTLIVAFAGIGPRDRPPSFSFLNAIGELTASKIFVRDPHRAWYHHGVPGLGDSIDAVASALKDLARASGARRIVTVGTSVGGYAALVFGRLLDAEAVLAFSPPTFLGWSMRLRYRNARYLRDRLRLSLSGRLDHRYTDLRRLLRTPGRSPLAAQAHYAALDRIDAGYARRIRDVAGITLVPHPCAGHDLVRRLRETGELPSLLAGVTGGPGRARAGLAPR